jgi:hypothetical protein
MYIYVHQFDDFPVPSPGLKWPEHEAEHYLNLLPRLKFMELHLHSIFFHGRVKAQEQIYLHLFIILMPVDTCV